jgi:hypothetical protein
VVANTSTARGMWFGHLSSLSTHPVIRKGKDYTYLYGAHVGTGSLTPHIDGAFDLRVDEYVSF